MPLNPILVQQVKQAMAAKRAFVPPGGGDPAAMGAAGGAPPMDPSMMGGAPPAGAPPMDPAMMAAMGGGGAPPMDPSMMGGAPPMDPAMMGGAPPMDPAMMGGAPPMDPAAMAGAAPAAPPSPSGASPEEIKAMIQAEIQKAIGGGGAGAPGGEGKPKSKGAGKVDPGQMIEYMERQQKLLINLYESLGLNLPYDILDKPKVDGGDAPKQEEAPAKEQISDTNVSGIPPIKPIDPIGGKQASVLEKAQAARYMLEALNRKG